MSSIRPKLSVIVPAHNGAAVLPLSLEALATSDFPREAWELIVVDDASRDGTATIAAKWADQVVALAGRPRGPAGARNQGAEVSRGDWLVFIDADVVVHADTLRRVAETIVQEPGIEAVFGAYDEHPPAPGVLSRYRNLMHRYVHLGGAGEAGTFWAGCGAVRRAAFNAVGGFDERRYPRPQIEDIELGYRLRDAGYRIVLCPEIQGAHLKRWSWIGSIRTDLFDRGIPWVRLLLQRRHHCTPAAHLNIKAGEQVKTALVWLGLALILGGLFMASPTVLAAGGSMILAVVLWNLPVFHWFRRQRGTGFALAVVPLNLWYYFLNGVAVAGGVLLHLAAPHARPATSTSFDPWLRRP